MEFCQFDSLLILYSLRSLLLVSVSQGLAFLLFLSRTGLPTPFIWWEIRWGRIGLFSEERRLLSWWTTYSPVSIRRSLPTAKCTSHRCCRSAWPLACSWKCLRCSLEACPLYYAVVARPNHQIAERTGLFLWEPTVMFVLSGLCFRIGVCLRTFLSSSN